jgi:hypothetical protein
LNEAEADASGGIRSAELTPYPKKVIHLPSIHSREEVNSLIEAASFYCAPMGPRYGGLATIRYWP